MSKIHLDMSDFEHVKTDKDKTTLRSKKFKHQVTIAHNAVHPDMRKVLESLAPLSEETQKKAKGGSVERMNTTNNINGTKSEPGYTKMAQGGHPTMEDIKHGDPNSAGLPCLNPHCKSHGKPHPNCRCYSGGGEYARGGKVKTRSACAERLAHEEGCEYYAEGGETESSGPDTLAPQKDKAEAAQRGMNQSVGDQLEQGAKRLSDPSSWWAKGGEVQNENPDMMSARQPFKDGGEAETEEITPKQGIKLGADHNNVMEGLHALGSWIKDKANNQMYGQSTPASDQSTPASDQSAPPQTQPNSDMSTGIATPPNTSSQPPIVPDTDSTQAAQPNPNDNPQPTAPSNVNTQAFSPAQVANQAHQQAVQLDPQAQLTQDERTKYAHDHLLWEQDLKDQHITPKTYQDLFNSKSTAGKIGTIFGLLVGGAGAGLTHQPSTLMNMMTKELENDFDAQKKSKENAQNFLRLQQQSPLIQSQTNLNNAQKEQIAMNLSKAKGYGAMMHQLIQQRDGYAEGTSKRQQADQMIQQIWPMYMEHASNLVDGAAAISSFTGGSPGPDQDAVLDSRINSMMRSQDPKLMEQGRRLEASRIPGVGATKDGSPVPPDKKDLVTGMNTLDYKAKDLLNFMDQHKGIDPSRWSPAVRREGEAKLGEMRNFYNGSIQGGALTALKDETYDNLFGKGAPTDIWPQLMGNRAAFKEVMDSNLGRRDILLKSLNIPIPKNQSYMPNNMSSSQPSNSPIKGKDGRMYIKDPSGKFMVPVK